jgi:hypothetical protein
MAFSFHVCACAPADAIKRREAGDCTPCDGERKRRIRRAKVGNRARAGARPAISLVARFGPR